MLDVETNRFDHEIELVGTVDLARYAVGHTGLKKLGFGEVIEPVNSPRVAVLQQEHRIGRVFRPREQEQVIGAEIEHGGNEKRRLHRPPPLGSAVEGLPGGLLRFGISPQRSACSEPKERYSSGEEEFLLALRRLSPPSRKISEFSTKRSAIAVAMVVLNRMLPQSENGVLVVMMVDRFWLWRVEIT